ncbi:MAG TPA: hypothetical protein VFZ48_00640 [Candidatus Saccharimonadales bacterium]
MTILKEFERELVRACEVANQGIPGERYDLEFQLKLSITEDGRIQVIVWNDELWSSVRAMCEHYGTDLECVDHTLPQFISFEPNPR